MTIQDCEPVAIAFTRWYILECLRQHVSCDGDAYDLPDAYADWIESKR